MSDTAHTQSVGSNLDHNARSLRAVYAQLSAGGEPNATGLNKEAEPVGLVEDMGSIYAFCSAHSRSGTSYVARNMALNAAQMMAEQNNQNTLAEGDDPWGSTIKTQDRVLLIDLDIGANTHSNWFFNQAKNTGLAMPHGPYDAAFSQIPFWRVTPSMVNDQGQNITDTHFMSLHMLHDVPLAFLHFRWDLFRQGQAVHIQNSRQYWHELRRQFRAVFVDTPAQDRSSLLSSIAVDVDANVIVCGPEQAQTSVVDDMSKQITDLGAHCAGVIINQTPAQADVDTMPEGEPS